MNMPENVDSVARIDGKYYLELPLAWERKSKVPIAVVELVKFYHIPTRLATYARGGQHEILLLAMTSAIYVQEVRPYEDLGGRWFKEHMPPNKSPVAHREHQSLLYKKDWLVLLTSASLHPIKQMDASYVCNMMDDARLETALGHKQELKRHFDLFSLVSLGIVIANSWAVTGGTIVAALQDGGPMAILYGLILVSIFYTLISASLSELASSMPSAGGVYYWASVSSREYGRFVGFLTGYLNACAWLLSAASISSMLGNEAVAMYLLLNPGSQWHSWQVFIVFQLLAWICCAIVCFGNKLIPLLNRVALVLSMCGLLVTVMVLAVMPRRHANNAEVWRRYHNNTGGWSDGICFLIGLINPAFSVGVPDCITHLSEEVVKPEIRVPQGTMLQMLTAFITTFVYLIALFYSIEDLDAVLHSEISSFPTAEIYRQATGSRAGAVGLVAVLFLTAFPTLVGVYITGGRMWWSLARDNATPFAPYFSYVHPTRKNPIRATVAMAGMVSFLGCIYIGSTTAFQALLSSYIVLSTLSYLGAILPHVLTGRKNIVPGPFYMGRRMGLVVNGVTVVYILVTIVFFCFPLTLPVTVHNMNYSSVIAVGLTTLTALWWFIRGKRDYRGPQYSVEIAQSLPAELETKEEGTILTEEHSSLPGDHTNV